VNRPTTLLLLTLAGFTPAAAQEPLMIIDGLQPNHSLGFDAMAFAGDVNGDGYDDIVTSALDWQNFAWSFFEVYSGLDGSMIHSWRFGGGISNAHSHSCSTAGDMDGDGFDDVVLGGTDGTIHFVEVRSGKTGLLIHNWTSQYPIYLGITVRGGGDVNGDGIPDVIARETDSQSGSKVKVYSGATGQILYVLDRYSNPNEWSVQFGVALDFTGDLNGDGCDDFIVGDRYSNLGGLRFGAAFVFSGADGQLLFSFSGHQFQNDFGRAVAGPGDMNGDGVPDIAVGTPAFDGVGDDSGLVQIYSGVDGTQLFWLEGKSTRESLGVKLAVAGDVNADGRADLVVLGGSDLKLGLLCRVFSGLDGTPLTVQGGSGLYSYGSSIAGGGDFNGDGFADFAVAEGEYNNWTGRIFIYPGSPVLQVDPLTASQRSDFQVSHFAKDKKVRLACSLTGLGATSIPQLGLSLDILQPALVAGPTLADPLGQVTWNIQVPANASGITIWMQAAQYGLKTNVVSQTIQ
jgi:FG-GAP repeat/FG-GAP-like repeat